MQACSKSGVASVSEERKGTLRPHVWAKRLVGQCATCHFQKVFSKFGGFCNGLWPGVCQSNMMHLDIEMTTDIGSFWPVEKVLTEV